LSPRFRGLSIQSETSASASGRRARRWVLPSITRLTTPASSSVRRCREIVGLETSKPYVASPTVAGPWLRRSTISRRSGWARAPNTSLAILLTIYRSTAAQGGAGDVRAQDRNPRGMERRASWLGGDDERLGGGGPAGRG